MTLFFNKYLTTIYWGSQSVHEKAMMTVSLGAKTVATISD